MEPTKCSGCKELPTIRWFGDHWETMCDKKTRPGCSFASGKTVDETVKRWNKNQGRRRIGLPLNSLNGGGTHANAKEKK